MKTINVVKDFKQQPFGRKDGEVFRKIMLSSLKRGHSLVVDLSGYNRYGPSFIDEAFGGLTFKEGLTPTYLKDMLTIKHDTLPSFAELAWSRINKGELQWKAKQESNDHGHHIKEWCDVTVGF